MRKIGILTMPVKENYGGIIQAAALYHYLEKEGYLPYLIMKKYDEGVLKRTFRFILSHNPLATIYDYKNLTKREKQASLLKNFITDFFKNRTKNTYSIDSYQRSVKELDTIIVGSDQVWRYKYIGNNYPYYFLAYLPDTMKRIAYAASFGVDIWEGDKTSITHINSLLKKFNAVSTREKSGVDICENTFDYYQANNVLDPTFLPDVSFYNELINKKNISKEVGLFTYVLDNSSCINEIITKVEEDRNIKRYAIELTNYSKGVKPSIEEWLYHFREAKYVVTDSFHGVVFCIIFEKQFICVANEDRGLTRFESLLTLFGLNNRIMHKYNSELLCELLRTDIDYNEVNSIVQENRDFAISFLNKSLNE